MLEFELFFIHSQGVHSVPYFGFIRLHHCCLISNGKRVFMNVHKHISCQVSVLCMLSKDLGVLIIFPRTGATGCVSSKERIGSGAGSDTRERRSRGWVSVRQLIQPPDIDHFSHFIVSLRLILSYK